MITVSLDALKLKGEDDSEISPEPGDEVSLGDAVGVLKSIKDGKAVIALKSVGGCECEDEASEQEPKDEEAEPDEAALMAMAKEEDRKNGYVD